MDPKCTPIPHDVDLARCAHCGSECMVLDGIELHPDPRIASETYFCASCGAEYSIVYAPALRVDYPTTHPPMTGWMPTITENREYVENPHACPYCTCTDIDASPLEQIDRTATALVRCTRCGHTWTETYRIAYISTT